MRHVRWRGIIILVAILLVVAMTLGVVFWMRATLEPSETALNALRSDDQVRVMEEVGLLTFGWAGVDSSTALIFYPGAGVDYRSYAPVLRQIAARGYFVVLPPMPLNLAFFNANVADQVVALYPDIDHWVIGGHSLGGVVAAGYAVNHPVIEGIVFWASYPGDDALKDKDIKVLSIYGSQDGLVTAGEIVSSRSLLPTDTIFVRIEGGNHSQFGSYGYQPGDGQASISPEEQWTKIADETAALLDIISN